MKSLILGVLIGSVLTTTIGVGAADYLGVGGESYLHPTTEIQAVLGDIRIREALETIQMGRQQYLDAQVRDAGKVPCR